MGFRFRKSIKVFPGIKLNLSKSGISTSIGGPGATINISSRGTRGTVGLPGTGISYSEKLSQSHTDHSQQNEQPASKPGMGFGALLGWGICALVAFMVISGLISK